MIQSSRDNGEHLEKINKLNDLHQNSSKKHQLLNEVKSMITKFKKEKLNISSKSPLKKLI